MTMNLDGNFPSYEVQQEILKRVNNTPSGAFNRDTKFVSFSNVSTSFTNILNITGSGELVHFSVQNDMSNTFKIIVDGITIGEIDFFVNSGRTETQSLYFPIRFKTSLTIQTKSYSPTYGSSGRFFYNLDK